jgi:phosphoenolpyruvate---glycerone phosphotransferase subunit DhaL
MNASHRPQGIGPLLIAAAREKIAEAETLTALDQAIGGDHGHNMRRGMEALPAELPKQADKPSGEVLKACGMQLVMKVGGASGPLFGTLLMELGKNWPPTIGREELAGTISAVKARGKSDVWQKTMLDLLVHVSAALRAGASTPEIAACAIAAVDATAPIQAIRGRASFLGPRSIGHVDPGARSVALMTASIAEALA